MISDDIQERIRRFSKDEDAYQSLIALFHEQKAYTNQASGLDSNNQSQPNSHQTLPLEHLRFLNRTAFELINLPDEDSIYTYMGKQLYQLLEGEAIIILSHNIHDEDTMRLQGVYGLNETQLGRVMRLMGYSLVGRHFEDDPYVTPLYNKGQLIHFEGGLVELAKRVVSPLITNQLVKIFNLGEVYLMGLQKDGILYAGAQIHMRGKRLIEHPDLIEAFIQQASTAIQRIQAVTSLRESELHYRSLFEQSNDAVFILDLEGNHIQVNQRAADLFGYEHEELFGLSYQEMVVQDEHHQTQNVLQHLLAGEHVPPYERTFRRKDGSLLPTEINVEIVRDQDGSPLHIQSVVRDITRRKQAEQRQFELALEKERIRVLATFIKDAGHEFKTPLSIINSSAFIMSKSDDLEQRQKNEDKIHVQVNRINTLVEMLLTIATLEDTSKLTHTQVDLLTIGTGLCDTMRYQTQNMPTLHFSAPNDLSLIMGDVTYLTKALQHLLDNAYRFTPQDGSITVTMRRIDSHICIDISDTGIGISGQDLPQIFQTFWRKDEAHSTPGFGLGLPIAQKIIEKHDGTITVESKVGQGTTVLIKLPITVIGDRH